MDDPLRLPASFGLRHRGRVAVLGLIDSGVRLAVAEATSGTDACSPERLNYPRRVVIRYLYRSLFEPAGLLSALLDSGGSLG